MTLVREIRPEDVSAVAALERELFPLGPDEDALRRMLAGQNTRALCVCEDGALLGCGWFQYVLDEGYVGDLAVAEAHRRRGLGEALLTALLDRARELDLAFLTLEVRESNLPARRLYEKTGFTEVGHRKNYYERPREDAVLMTFSFRREEETC